MRRRARLPARSPTRRRAACMAKASSLSSWSRSSSGPGTSTEIPGSRALVFDQLEVLGDLGGLAEHDRSRAVLLVRQPDRLLDEVALQAASAHVLAALFEDHDHVVGGAAAGTDEHQLHRPRRKVAAAAIGRAVHRDDVIASGLGEEGHSVAAPTYGAVHGVLCFSAACARQHHACYKCLCVNDLGVAGERLRLYSSPPSSSFGGFGATLASRAAFLCKIRSFSAFPGNSRMKTYTAKVGEVEQGWFLVDAQGKVLGRLAVQIATRLRGKHKPQYTPHVDTGDYIVVVNASKLRVTGRKTERKTYYSHS